MQKHVMNEKYCWLMLTLATLAGFVGGAVANRFLTTQPVFAEKKAKPMKIIEAEKIRRVDREGKIRAELEADRFALWDKKGNGTNIYPHYLDVYSEKSFGRITPSALILQMKDCSTGLGCHLFDEEFVSILLVDKRRKTRAQLMFGGRSTNLILTDENGYRAVLGCTGIFNKRTGTIEKRPASSLILFDKEEKVIWSVP